MKEFVEYTKEQKLIVEFVDQLEKKFGREYWLAKAENKEFMQELWDEIANNGYFGMVIPEKYGGSNFKFADLIVFLEEISRRGLGTMHLISIFMDCIIIMQGDEKLKQKFLPKIVDGTYFSFAITEPDAGTNTFNLATTAKRDGEYYRINGQKIFITGADESEYMVVVTRTKAAGEGITKRDGFSVFVVDSHAEGLTTQLQNIEIVVPERQYAVFFDDVKVPAENLIGEEHKGMDVLFHGLNLERIIVSAFAIGMGKHVLAKGIDYAKKRNLFGTPIAAYQGLAHPLTRAYVGLQLASTANHKAVEALDKGDDIGLIGLYANMAKLVGSEEAYKACDIAVQVHGGYSMTAEYDLAKFINMIRTMRLAPINNEMVLNFIGQHYLGLPRNY